MQYARIRRDDRLDTPCPLSQEELYTNLIKEFEEAIKTEKEWVEHPSRETWQCKFVWAALPSLENCLPTIRKARESNRPIQELARELYDFLKRAKSSHNELWNDEYSLGSSTIGRGMNVVEPYIDLRFVPITVDPSTHKASFKLLSKKPDVEVKPPAPPDPIPVNITPHDPPAVFQPQVEFEHKSDPPPRLGLMQRIWRIFR